MKKIIFLWVANLAILFLFSLEVSLGIVQQNWLHLSLSACSVIINAYLYVRVKKQIKNTETEHQIGLFVMFGLSSLLGLLIFAETVNRFGSTENPCIKITFAIFAVCIFIFSFIYFTKVIGIVKKE